MRRPVMLRLTVWMVLLSAVGLGGCGDDEVTTWESRNFVYPDPEWTVGTPEAQDMDSLLLEEAADFAEEYASNCLVVTRDGVIVGEWYWNGWGETTEQNVYSVTKSFTSALVGIAQDRGELDIAEKASEYIPEWIGTPSEEVTIQNLISNDSGRYWDFVTDYVRNYFLAEDKTTHAIGLGQEFDPGTVWTYNNSAIQTLEQILSLSTGMDVADYAEEFLFEPLGMSSSYGHDRAGNTVVYADISASCRDLARFGCLFLQEGRWADDERIISEAWVEESVRPSTPLNSAYGYMWWLNREGRWVSPSIPENQVHQGRPMAGLPQNVFRASGAFNQIIFVDPNTNVVFTRIGWIRDLADLSSSELVEGLAERIRAARMD